MHDINDILTANVKRICKAEHIKIDDLAARLNVSRQQIYNYLKRGTLATLERIAAALNTTPAALLADPAQEDHTNPARIRCPHCGKPLTIHVAPDE